MAKNEKTEESVYKENMVNMVNLVNLMAETPEFEYLEPLSQINHRLTKLTTELTKLTTLTKLTSLTILTTTKQKILLLTILPNTIDNIRKEIGVSSQVISQALQRSGRSTGLLTEGFIRLIEKNGNVVKYQITQKGAIQLKELIDEKQEQVHKEEVLLEKLRDVSEKLDETVNFLEMYCMENIVNQQAKGKHYINIDFTDILAFGPALAISLLDEPDEGFKIFQMALERLIETKVNKDIKEEFEIRLFNLPKGSEILIGDIRSKH